MNIFSDEGNSLFVSVKETNDFAQKVILLKNSDFLRICFKWVYCFNVIELAPNISQLL